MNRISERSTMILLVHASTGMPKISTRRSWKNDWAEKYSIISPDVRGWLMIGNNSTTKFAHIKASGCRLHWSMQRRFQCALGFLLPYALTPEVSCTTGPAWCMVLLVTQFGHNSRWPTRLPDGFWWYNKETRFSSNWSQECGYIWKLRWRARCPQRKSKGDLTNVIQNGLCLW